jgi:hypothetical protein
MPENSPVICQLAQAVLAAALLGKPYPGQKTQPAPFPDIESVRGQEEIVISNRRLEATCSLTVPGYRVAVLSEDEIGRRANAQGDFPYFSLTEANIGPDQATLALQLSYAASEASQRAGRLYLGGGGVRVRFERIEGEWQAPSGPIATWMA